LGAAGGKKYAQFKKLKEMSEAGEAVDQELKENLCAAVALYRAALAGSSDPGNRRYRSPEEQRAGVDWCAARSAARNLLLCLSHLAPRVVESARVSIYSDATEALSVALRMNGTDQSWLQAVEGRPRPIGEIFADMVKEMDIPTMEGDALASATEKVISHLTSENCIEN
jgi:hypothetical protein